MVKLTTELERALGQVLDQIEQSGLDETKGFSFSEESRKKFLSYFSYLLEMNQVMNLTAITTPREVARLHLYDSLTLLPYLPRQKGLRLIDVGTGAGLPGIPLKIARPDLDLVLLDSLEKRIRFLRECAARIPLTEPVDFIHARAEDAARQPDLREQFDLATARAVASLDVLSEFCLPFVKPGGLMIAMKSRADQEIETARRALKILGGEVAEVVNFVLPDDGAPRSLVLIKKVQPTPKRYPRRPGKPKAQPL